MQRPWRDPALERRPGYGKDPATLALTRRARRPFRAQNGEQNMVLPAPIDAEVVAGIAFLAEAAMKEEGAAWHIVGEARGFHPMEPQMIEGKAQHEAQPFGHAALSRITLAHPIAEAPRFGHAAAHIAETDAAEERLIGAPEEQEAIAEIGTPIGIISLQTPAKGGAGELIRHPSGFPRHQEIPGLAPQFGPFPPIAPLRRARHHPLPHEAKRGRPCEKPRQTQEIGGHALSPTL